MGVQPHEREDIEAACAPPELGKYLDYDQYFMIAVVSHIAKAPHNDETCVFSLSSQKDRLLWSVGSEKSGNNLDKICQK